MKVFKTVTDTWLISKTTRLFGLTLTETGKIIAPEGKLVTLVYNGENLPLLPGQYEGDVVLEVTDAISYQDAPLRAAVALVNGQYVPEKSVTAAALGGTVENNSVRGISVTSMEEAVNGIFASIPEGENTVIENVTLNMLGNGGNDFIGYGAAIAACGKGKLTVNSSDITTHGAARGAIYAGENVELEVNDSKIHTKGGVLNADYQDTIKTTLPGVMRRVPWMLGLRGNCRATNLLDYATATYNRCDITADGWGVMSTDGVKRCRMKINDSNVSITGSSGYGALSIGDCVVDFDNSTVSVPDYGMIMMMGKGSGSFKNGTVVNSGRFATMSSMNSGLVQVSGATLNTGEATFLVRGCSTEFQVENSTLHSENGILLQVMNGDDPGNPTGYYMDPTEPDMPLEGRDLYTAVSGTDVVAHFKNMTLQGDMFNGSSENTGDTGGANLLSGGPGGDMPPMDDFPQMPAGGPPAGMPPMGDFPQMPAGGPPAGMPPMGDFPGGPGGDVPGDFSMPGFGGPNAKNLHITLEHVDYTGRITASVSRHRLEKVCKENCEELGEVINTPQEAINNGVIVSLDKETTWTVTDTCYLTALHIGESAAVKAGHFTVDGVETPLQPGHYCGKLVLTP